jgi:hypothetical protein
MSVAPGANRPRLEPSVNVRAAKADFLGRDSDMRQAASLAPKAAGARHYAQQFRGLFFGEYVRWCNFHGTIKTCLY